MAQDSRITIVCDVNYKKLVEEYADQDGRSVSDYCRRAVSQQMGRDLENRNLKITKEIKSKY